MHEEATWTIRVSCGLQPAYRSQCEMAMETLSPITSASARLIRRFQALRQEQARRLVAQRLHKSSRTGSGCTKVGAPSECNVLIANTS